MTDFGAWTVEYLELVSTKQKLEAFMEERYEAHLREIARIWAKAREPRLTLPCDDCRVEISSLVEPGKGWYFEWNCRAWSPCGASGEGWNVPLAEIKAHLAPHGIT